jgi:hypothetical protein
VRARLPGWNGSTFDEGALLLNIVRITAGGEAEVRRATNL